MPRKFKKSKVSICVYANRKYRTLRKCATGNQIVIIQYRGASEHSLKRSGVYERNRNTATQTINQKTKDGEENLVANIIHHQLLEDGAVRIRLFEFRLFRRIFNVVQCLLLPRLRLSSKESNDDSHQKGYNGQLRCKPHEPIEFVDTFVEYICCGSIFFVTVAIPVNMVFLDFVAIKHKQSSKQSPCCNTESVYD